MPYQIIVRTAPKDPFPLLGTLQPNPEQVRALRAAGDGKDLTGGPVQKVLGGQQLVAVAVQENGHDPEPALRHPGDLGVPVGKGDVRNHGIPFILAEGLSLVGAVGKGDFKCLASAPPAFGARRRIKQQHGPLALFPQAGDILLVHHAAAGVDASLRPRQNGVGQLLPMAQVPADRVEPMGIAGGAAKGVQLRKVMVYPIVVQKAVGVIHKAMRGRKMALWTQRLPVDGRLVHIAVRQPQRIQQRLVPPGKPQGQLRSPGVAFQENRAPGPGRFIQRQLILLFQGLPLKNLQDLDSLSGYKVVFLSANRYKKISVVGTYSSFSHSALLLRS